MGFTLSKFAKEIEGKGQACDELLPPEFLQFRKTYDLQKKALRQQELAKKRERNIDRTVELHRNYNRELISMFEAMSEDREYLSALVRYWKSAKTVCPSDYETFVERTLKTYTMTDPILSDNPLNMNNPSEAVSVSYHNFLKKLLRGVGVPMKQLNAESRKFKKMIDQKFPTTA
jgi:hypothetical protein